MAFLQKCEQSALDKWNALEKRFDNWNILRSTVQHNFDNWNVERHFYNTEQNPLDKWNA